MNAGKNRKRDLVQLCEVYSTRLLGEGLKDYDPAQQQGGSQQARMAPNMGTETHTGAVQAGLNKDPLLNPEGESEETYEGEEETLQEKSGRMLTRQGWKKSEVTPKGNWVFTKADQPDAHVGTDGLINGKDYKLFSSVTGEDPGTEDEENDQSLPEPEDTGINADENRGSWGSAAFGNESEEGHEDHEMLIGRSGGCPGETTDHGAGDPTHNRHALGGAVDIIAKAISDQNKRSEDENEYDGQEDDDLYQKHMTKVHGPDTDDFDERYFKERDKQINAAARKQGFNPDENAEDDFPWPKKGMNDFEKAEDTDTSDKEKFKKLDPRQWRKAKDEGWDEESALRNVDKPTKKESYFKSRGDKAMTQLMESYESVVKGNHGQIL